MRARTNVAEISADLMSALGELRPSMQGNDAFAHIETFCAIALRVMSKTNPSKIRSEAMTVEIQARMAGREVA